MGRHSQSGPGALLSRGHRAGLFQTSDWPDGRPIILLGCRPQGLDHGAACWSTIGSLVYDRSAAWAASEPGSRRMGFHSESDDWSTLPPVQLSLAEWWPQLLCGSGDGSDAVRAIGHVVG